MRTREGSRVVQLTVTEGAVLGLLAIEGERTGYDLLKLARRSVAHVWAPAKSQLYAVLPRLERDGLARSRAGGRDRGPDRRLYRITKGGERALKTWLEAVEPGDRDGFYLKSFLGGLMSPEALVGHYRQFRVDTLEQLAVYQQLEPTNSRRGHDYYHYFLLKLGIEQAELALRWADEVLAELEP
ncbi:MAG: PadR family transcriptional regulator [Gaiellaceae bacterium]